MDGRDYCWKYALGMVGISVCLTIGSSTFARAATYYVDSSQTGYNGASAPTARSACAAADAGSGTSSGSPKCTLASISAIQASLKPGDQVLFKCGDTWSEELSITNLQGASGNPVILGNPVVAGACTYGTGARPIIDGGGKRNTCVNAWSTTAKYITIDSFECRNSTENGISFQTSGGAMPGITVQNSYIHNTGPGAYASTSRHSRGPYDDGHYRNQLDFEDYASGAGQDGVKFLNNTVNNCGGHNCLEVQYDGGGPIVQGNIVGPGCLHNCIDVKGATNGTIDSNVATTGVTSGAAGCIYLENTYSPTSSVLVTRNVCYSSGVGFQVDTGGSCTQSQCLQTIQGYNNTMVAPTNSAFPIIVGGSFSPSYITITWEDNIIDGGTEVVDAGVKWTGDYNDDGGHQGLYATNVSPGSHDLSLALNPLSIIDPGYMNFTGNNFHPASCSSPVASAGLPGLVSGMTSMGAYSAPCP